MPDGVARLEALGVDPLAAGGRPLRGVRWVDGDLSVSAQFPGSPGVGVRRTSLHRSLLGAVLASGSRVDFGVTVRGLTPAGGGVVGVRTDRGSFEGTFLVGADGLASRVRRWSGLEVPSSGRRLGVRRHYRIEPWTDLVEVHWVDGCEAYVTPVGTREVGVAMLFRGPKGRFDDLLRGFPSLGARLAGSEVVSSDRGAGPLERRTRAVVAGRVALVGDAAGYLDAITGEGLTAAIAQAEALAAALHTDRLERYAVAHRRLRRRPNLLIRTLLEIERRPWLRRRMMSALAADPTLFARLLEVHVGERRALSAAWRGVVGTGRLLLAGRR